MGPGILTPLSASFSIARALVYELNRVSRANQGFYDSVFPRSNEHLTRTPDVSRWAFARSKDRLVALANRRPTIPTRRKATFAAISRR
jgi:hypothetical protein